MIESSVDFELSKPQTAVYPVIQSLNDSLIQSL